MGLRSSRSIWNSRDVTTRSNDRKRCSRRTNLSRTSVKRWRIDEDSFAVEIPKFEDVNAEVLPVSAERVRGFASNNQAIKRYAAKATGG